jgi:hypothetical protein
MASYCNVCGNRHADIDMQHCPNCARHTARLELAEATFGRLWSSAARVLQNDIGISEITWPQGWLDGPQITLGDYDPEPPGRLVLNLLRPDEEITLAGACEENGDTSRRGHGW